MTYLTFELIAAQNSNAPA